MSYIRCLSNPEGMYIYSSARNVTISHNVKKPRSSGGDFQIPIKTFNRLCWKWVDCYEPATYRGAVAEEVHVNQWTGEVIPDSKPCGKGCKMIGGGGWTPCKRCMRKSLKNAEEGKFLIRLSYGGHFVDMWRVTWEYIARNADGRKKK